jgi:hypothetical protein
MAAGSRGAGAGSGERRGGGRDWRRRAIVWWHIRESIPLARSEGLNIKRDISIPVSRISPALNRRVAGA